MQCCLEMPGGSIYTNKIQWICHRCRIKKSKTKTSLSYLISESFWMEVSSRLGCWNSGSRTPSASGSRTVLILLFRKLNSLSASCRHTQVMLCWVERHHRYRAVPVTKSHLHFLLVGHLVLCRWFSDIIRCRVVFGSWCGFFVEIQLGHQWIAVSGAEEGEFYFTSFKRQQKNPQIIRLHLPVTNLTQLPLFWEISDHRSENQPLSSFFLLCERTDY